MTVVPFLSQNAAESPASAITVAITGTHALVRQLSTKYQKAKRRRNGTTIAVAIHSCERSAGGNCGCPTIATTTISAYTTRRTSQMRNAPPSEHMSLRVFCKLTIDEVDVAEGADVAVVVGTGVGAGVGVEGAGVGVGRTTGDGAGEGAGVGAGAWADPSEATPVE